MEHAIASVGANSGEISFQLVGQVVVNHAQSTVCDMGKVWRSGKIHYIDHMLKVKKGGPKAAFWVLLATQRDQRQLAGRCFLRPAVLVQTQVIMSFLVAWVGVRIRFGSTAAPVFFVWPVMTPFAIATELM